jgi:hypothetical protein
MISTNYKQKGMKIGKQSKSNKEQEKKPLDSSTAS